MCYVRISKRLDEWKVATLTPTLAGGHLPRISVFSGTTSTLNARGIEHIHPSTNAMFIPPLMS